MYHWLVPESSVKLSKRGSNREAPMRNRNAAFFAAGGFAAALFLAGAAHAITDTVFKYSTPKTGYLTLDPMAFAPDNSNDAGHYFVSWGNGMTTDLTTCVNTGINL